MAVSKTSSASRAKSSSRSRRSSTSRRTSKTRGSARTKVGAKPKTKAANKTKATDAAKVSKEARSKDKVSPERAQHLKALENTLGITEADKEAASVSAASAAPGSVPADDGGFSVIDSAQRAADVTKVGADRLKGAAKAIRQTVGARGSVGQATKAAEKRTGKASKGLHGLAAGAGLTNLVANGGSMNGTELAATTSGLAADAASTLDNGGKAAKAGSKLGKAFGSLRTGASRFAGPLGIAAKGFEGVSQMNNGATRSERTEGAFKTAAAVGTTKVSTAALLGGAGKIAARANVVGAAAISGIEGIGQISRAENTQDLVAGSLKTGAGAALAAAAVPGPHSVPLAIAGAGMYAGGVVADNWDTVTSAAGWVGKQVGSWF